LNRIKEIISKLRGLSYIGIADIGGSGIAAVFWFFIAAFVGVKDYGQISYFLAISGVTATISLVGASNMILVNAPKGVKIQPPMFLISIIFGSISASILYFIFFRFELSVLTIGYVVFNLAITDLLGLKLYKNYLRYVVTQKILMVIFGIGFYYVFGAPGVIFGVGISYLPYLHRIISSFRKERMDFSLIKSRTGFLINSYILDLSNVFIGSIDKIIIAPFFGFLILGNYQLGIQFLSVLYIVPNVFYKFLITQESSGNSTAKLTKYVVLTAVGLCLVGLFISPLAIPVFFPQFTETTKVLQIVSFAVVPNTVNLIFISKFLASEKSRIVLVGSMIFLAAQITSIILLGGTYGITGIAVSLVLSETIQMIYFFIIRRLSDEGLYNKNNVKIN
jgi:O-antigen/teichoic acid export membrane protein